MLKKKTETSKKKSLLPESGSVTEGYEKKIRPPQQSCGLVARRKKSWEEAP